MCTHFPLMFLPNRGLAEIPESERRQMLRRMGDEEYETMVSILHNFPLLELTARVHVIDDAETDIITAGE